MKKMAQHEKGEFPEIEKALADQSNPALQKAMDEWLKKLDEFALLLRREFGSA